MAAPKRKLWRLLAGVVIVVNIVLFASGKGYYYKALFYNYVNIDDLDLFHVRTVEPGKGEPWNVGHDYNKMQLTPALEATLKQSGCAGTRSRFAAARRARARATPSPRCRPGPRA